MSIRMKISTAVLVALAAILTAKVAQADLVLGAPPRETVAAGQKVYGPLADYLSQAIGERIVYDHPANWGIYQAMMTLGSYDLVFDGPHFVDWRIEHLNHVPLVALNGKLSFVVISRANDPHVRTLADLAGRGVCAHAPPNLATLTLLDQFSNPARQPLLVDIKGFPAAYDGLIDGKCSGTVLPVELYKKLDGEHRRTRVLYESQVLPNQALTSGPHVSAEARTRIIDALVSPKNPSVVQLIAQSLGGESFSQTTASQYKGYDGLLRNVWGFAPPQ